MHVQHLRLRNFHALDLHRGCLPLAGQLVQGLPLMLGRGIGGHFLLGQNLPAGHFGPHSLLVNAVPRGLAQHLSLDVPGIGFLPDTQLTAVNLAAVRQQVRGDLGALPQQHQQHARSHGVQGAGMTDFLLPQTLEHGKTAGRCRPGRLVEHQHAMQLRQRGRLQIAVRHSADRENSREGRSSQRLFRTDTFLPGPHSSAGSGAASRKPAAHSCCRRRCTSRRMMRGAVPGKASSSSAASSASLPAVSQSCQRTQPMPLR